VQVRPGKAQCRSICPDMAMYGPIWPYMAIWKMGMGIKRK